MKKVLTAAALLLCLLLAASQDSSTRDAVAAELPIPSAEDISIQAYGDKNKSCQEWTDGCRTCQRSDAKEPACSNIGIACQPKAISCTKRTEPPK
jgi:hypothetical protein